MPSESALLAGPAEAPRAAALQPARGQEPPQRRGGAQVPTALQVDSFVGPLCTWPGTPGNLQPTGTRCSHSDGSPARETPCPMAPSCTHPPVLNTPCPSTARRHTGQEGRGDRDGRGVHHTPTLAFGTGSFSSRPPGLRKGSKRPVKLSCRDVPATSSWCSDSGAKPKALQQT